MDLGLKNRVALVAASSKGLGRASAEAIAAEGGKVTICARDAGALEKTRAEMAAAGFDVLAVAADMTSAADIETVVNRTVEHFGGLHILVTNAGGPPPGYFLDFDDETWEAAANLTLMSAVRLIRAALPHMQAAGWGRIINITSISVKEPVGNLLLSNAMRPAVHGLAKTLANEVAGQGITVNNVMPGYTHTDRIQQLAEARAAESGKTPEEIVAGLGEPVPMGRVGQPAEFGAVVAFLASEKASYVNGVSIPVDGGFIKAAF
jgi:3-oxoacyl-[acyl-carrier protein] reductase